MESKLTKKCSVSNVVTYIIYGILIAFAVVLIEELIRNFIVKTENIFITQLG